MRVCFTRRYVHRLMAATAIGCYFSLPSISQAELYRLHYTGYVYQIQSDGIFGEQNRVDTAGLFGPVGGNLIGLPATTNLYLSVPTPGAYYSNIPSAGITYIAGGAGAQSLSLPAASPSPMYGYVDINGIKKYVDGGYYASLSEVNSARDSLFSQVDSINQTISETLSNINNDRSPNFITGSGFPPLLNYTYQIGDDAFGFYEYRSGAGANESFEDVAFGIDALQISLASAVPEPSMWTMILAGTGLIGAFMRKRRSARLAASVA